MAQAQPGLGLGAPTALMYKTEHMKRPELPNSEVVWILLSLGDCGETTDWAGLLIIQSSINSFDRVAPVQPLR